MIAGAIPRSGWLLPDYKFGAPNSNSNPRNKTHFAERNIILPSKLSLQVKPASFFSTKAVSSSSVGNTEYAEEPATNVQFQTSLSLPGCSSLLSLIGIGYREKVFAIIGVKVYAAGLYINPSILNNIKAWRGRSATEIQASLEKSLQIILARDVEGKTFWDALDEAVSPRIKSPTSVDQTALDTFRSVFQGRPLKKGTFIFLTWLNPAKMMIHLSAGETPSAADATIESENVAFALFDVFLGRDPVSPSLKASVSNGLASALN